MEKVYCLTVTKTFRDECYGAPDVTICKTRELALREFFKAIEEELDEYLEEEDLEYCNIQDVKTLDDLDLNEKISLYGECYFDVDYCFDYGNEHCSFDTSDESSVSFVISECDMVTE